MSRTAHKIQQTFHVDYNVVFEERLGPGDVLQTELFETITTEGLLPLAQENILGRVNVLRAQKVGHNTFIAKVESTGSAEYFSKVLNTAPDNLVGYWPQWELSGSTAQDLSSQKNNGAYTGVTLGQTGIGDGRTCPLFDGSGINNVYSTALNADFSGTVGTAMIWLKVNDNSVWTDGATRRALIIYADPDNYFLIEKRNLDNRLRFLYSAGSTVDAVTVAGQTSTNFLLCTMTWDKAKEEVKMYIGASQVGGTQVDLGTWAGTLNGNLCVIGGTNIAPINPWSGYLAHIALWNTALTATQIEKLSKV